MNLNSCDERKEIFCGDPVIIHPTPFGPSTIETTSHNSPHRRRNPKSHLCEECRSLSKKSQMLDIKMVVMTWQELGGAQWRACPVAGTLLPRTFTVRRPCWLYNPVNHLPLQYTETTIAKLPQTSYVRMQKKGGEE